MEKVKNNPTGTDLMLVVVNKRHRHCLPRLRRQSQNTGKWHTGSVNLAMKRLNNKFQPKDVMSKATQDKRLTTLKLKSGRDPDQYGTESVSLRIEYQNELGEDDKILAAFTVAGLD